MAQSQTRPYSPASYSQERVAATNQRSNESENRARGQFARVLSEWVLTTRAAQGALSHAWSHPWPHDGLEALRRAKDAWRGEPFRALIDAWKRDRLPPGTPLWDS
jgi:hypothetical protein